MSGVSMLTISGSAASAAGLTLAAAFLAQYRTVFMLVGLATTLAGIGVMMRILLRERRRALASALAVMMEAT